MKRRVGLIFVALSAAIVAGCGGGAGTEANPQTNPPQTSTYSGPPPATADVNNFMIEVWEQLRPGNGRCGECHSQSGGQSPMFARDDDVNLAYSEALSLVNLASPSDSRLVTKVEGGHNCWLTSDAACGAIMTGWIEAWAGVTTGSSGRQIELEAPVIKDVGASKNFPPTSAEFGAAGGIHELLTTYCSNCHSPAAGTPQTPYFADSDVDAAYEAVKSKINLDDPASSRLVIRLRNEFHNCWSQCGPTDTSPEDNDNEMETVLTAFSDNITPTQVDPALVISKALTIFDGTVASGGNRYETNQIALWEFKTGTGNTAFDTSGVDPAIDLTMSGSNVNWVGGWGIDIVDGKAQGSTTASRKLHDMIKSTGEYTIEAWVVPGNVVQEDTRIISYSAGPQARNFNLGQTLYSYDALTRSSLTDANANPGLSTSDADEDLQATLQHVVMTYDAVDGHRVYVNGVFTDDVDAGGGTLADWDDTFAFVLGNEVSGDRQWIGVIRMVAIHNRVMTPAQITQNFDVGVGQKFFLLFNVADHVAMPDAYIMFEVSQFDSYSYLFNSPLLISLDPTATPGSIPLRGMRIGINGLVPTVSQAYSKLDLTITDSSYDPNTGQVLSDLGTIVALEKGPDADEFFLSFEQLGGNTNVFVDSDGGLLPPPTPDVPVEAQPARLGLRTFDEINAMMSAATGVPVDEPNVQFTYDLVRQSIPAIEDIETFLSSHEIGIAQLAIEYCNALINDTGARATMFPAFNFGVLPATAYSGAARDNLIEPLLERMLGQINGVTNILTQPTFVELRDELGYVNAAPDHLNLVDKLMSSPDHVETLPRTADIAKGVCAAALGNGAVLIQ